MKYQCALLAVRDVEVSKRFYQELFDQTVVLDLGKNVNFSGGFAIQQDFGWLTGIPEGEIIWKSNNMELYFEVNDFDAFQQKLEARSDIIYLNHPMTHEWKQRVVRIYDPDFHIIEIGESMAVIARRYLSQGCSPEETARIIQHPIEFVKAVQESA
ncbi:MAG: glyoxalase/bleomycin resistance/dioxygenase family protein, partial [Oscillospiraceae bacterium]|nr:glyoxalase/bleomycin resistance/dioxygenase family protein [Oscillospiraceae bacterium]